MRNVIVIGMAGSGKTTLMQRINNYMYSQDKRPYILNLDPAVMHLPYQPSIDIRQTIDYKAVMEDYNLGPNGAILTSLNLFTTAFDKVLQLIEKRVAENAIDSVFVDTPGQIEIFTWSASGAIITETLALTHPTVVVYVMDTPRCQSPITFVSNMLYACSIMYKTRLPFILAFNKSDVADPSFALRWLTDFDALQEALDQDESYMSSLSRSMGLVLEEFYETIQACPVSAVTGEGMAALFDAISESEKTYYEVYKPEQDRLRGLQKQRDEASKQAQLEKIKRGIQARGVPDAKYSDQFELATSMQKVALSGQGDAEGDYVPSDTDEEGYKADFCDDPAECFEDYDESDEYSSHEDAKRLEDASFQAFLNAQR